MNDKDLKAESVNQEVDTYAAWIKARQEHLLKISNGNLDNLKIAENIITTKLNKVFDFKKTAKNKEDRYFSYNDFIKIPEVEQYFPIILAITPRNIGKSYSANKIIQEEYLAKGKKFVKMRLTAAQALDQAKSDEKDFLQNLGYEVDSKGTVMTVAKKEYVGKYVGLSNSANTKSMNFQNPDILFFEEFMLADQARKVTNKAQKLVRLLSTVQRHNPNFKIIGASNYGDDPNDELLRSFAGWDGSKKIIHFNWILGSILIMIPKGIYYAFDDDTSNIAHRAALQQDFGLYQAEYGDGFLESEIYNLMTPEQQLTLETQRGKTISSRFVIALDPNYKRWFTFSWDLKNKLIYIEPYIQSIHRNLVRYTTNTLVISEFKTFKRLGVQNLRSMINNWQLNLVKAYDTNTKFEISKFFSSIADVLNKQPK